MTQITNFCATIILFGALAAIPPYAGAASGEMLFEQLRQQVDRQRQEGSDDFLHWSGEQGKGYALVVGGNIIECTPDAINRLRANDKTLEISNSYIYNATYSQVTIPIDGKGKVCIFLTRPIYRSLTVEEEHDLIVADHLEFPPYHPTAGDLQIAEEEFQTLRTKARAVRAAMTRDQRSKIQEQIDGLVACSDKELVDSGIWREFAVDWGMDEFDSVNYVWNWAHSVDGDPCVYVRSPLHRALTVDEAQDLLTVTHLPLPSMQYALPISAAGARRKLGGQR